MHEIDFRVCPEWMNVSGSERCDLPAAVQKRSIRVDITGTSEYVVLLCPRGHHYDGPSDRLTREEAA